MQRERELGTLSESENHWQVLTLFVHDPSSPVPLSPISSGLWRRGLPMTVVEKELLVEKALIEGE